MPSTRRRLLASAGTALLGGCAGLAPRRREPADPDPFLTDPLDWAHPERDAANTNAAPAPGAPAEPASDPEWDVTATLTEIDAATAPVVADGIVYVALGGLAGGRELRRLIAIDALSGAERWRVDRPGGSTPVRPPAVAGETVFWAADRLLAIEPATGSRLWRREGDGLLGAHGTVVTVEDSDGDSVLLALDPATGGTYWSRRARDGRWLVLGAGDRDVYVSAVAGSEGQPSRLLALDPATGDTRWATDLLAPRQLTVGTDALFASVGRPDSQRFVALSPPGRRAEWTETADLQRRTAGGETVNGRQSVAAVAPDRLLTRREFFGYEHDRIAGRHPGDGTVDWTVAGSGPGAVRFAGPVVGGDRVYVVAERRVGGDPDSARLRVFDRGDGSERSATGLPGGSYHRPALARGALYLVGVVGNGRLRLTRR